MMSGDIHFSSSSCSFIGVCLAEAKALYMLARVLPVISLLCGQGSELRTSLWNSCLHLRSVQFIL